MGFGSQFTKRFLRVFFKYISLHLKSTAHRNLDFWFGSMFGSYLKFCISVSVQAMTLSVAYVLTESFTDFPWAYHFSSPSLVGFVLGYRCAVREIAAHQVIKYFKCHMVVPSWIHSRTHVFWEVMRKLIMEMDHLGWKRRLHLRTEALSVLGAFRYDLFRIFRQVVVQAVCVILRGSTKRLLDCKQERNWRTKRNAERPHQWPILRRWRAPHFRLWFRRVVQRSGRAWILASVTRSENGDEARSSGDRMSAGFLLRMKWCSCIAFWKPTCTVMAPACPRPVFVTNRAGAVIKHFPIYIRRMMVSIDHGRILKVTLFHPRLKARFFTTDHRSIDISVKPLMADFLREAIESIIERMAYNDVYLVAVNIELFTQSVDSRSTSVL